MGKCHPDIFEEVQTRTPCLKAPASVCLQNIFLLGYFSFFSPALMAFMNPHGSLHWNIRLNDWQPLCHSAPTCLLMAEGRHIIKPLKAYSLRLPQTTTPRY